VQDVLDGAGPDIGSISRPGYSVLLGILLPMFRDCRLGIFGTGLF
jgi:hypothetical protein